MLSIIGILLYTLVELLERAALPWHVSQRHDPRASKGGAAT